MADNNKEGNEIHLRGELRADIYIKTSSNESTVTVIRLYVKLRAVLRVFVPYCVRVV